MQSKMESKMFSCPLCCSTIFKSKELLLEHLSQITKNIVCPVCKAGISSIDGLIAHLKGNCVETITFIDEGGSQGQDMQQSEYHFDLGNNDPQENYTNNDAEVIENNPAEISEILDQQHVKIPELKLVKECSDRYVLIGNNDAENNSGTTLVSKQNDDGTVSFRLEESNPVNSEEETNEYSTKMEVENQELSEDVEENQEEVYSCNTCGVTFTSVIDHIQNYHSDQDVVVEETFETDDLSEEWQQVDEEIVDEKQTARRMITDTGDIVEENVQQTEQDDQVESTNDQNKPTILKTRRRYIRMSKADDAVKNNTKDGDAEEPDDSFHKGVMKMIKAPNGSLVRVYSCIHCNFLVSSLAEFQQHPCMKASNYNCSVCKVTYNNAKSLCAHMKVHKEKPNLKVTGAPPKYECEICSTKFPTSKSFKLHKRMHAPVKQRTIQSLLEKTANSENFQCAICQKIIPMHFRIMHLNSHKATNELICDMCNRKFPSRECLDMHMNVHNIYKVKVEKQEKFALPYKCIYCDRKFARPHEKVKHERIHTGEKPHVCEICGKSFRVSYCLTLHMRTHTGARPYECPHCPKKFKAHSVYNHHILTHSEVRAYKCPYCPKAFKTPVQLAGHKNSHTKPFSCQQCNRPFASLYAVRVHMEVHTRQNSLKFQCTECGASYARAFALRDHVQQAHAQPDAGGAEPVINEISMDSAELIIS